MRESIAISEIFGPTVQGEGPLIGQPTVFVRTGGCDYRCVWCDTLYAVLPEHRSEWVLMTPTEIERRIDELASNNPVLVTLSGGNPALQPLAPLIELGHAEGHRFVSERGLIIMSGCPNLCFWYKAEITIALTNVC